MKMRLLLFVFLAFTTAAFAQFPSRPVTIVVPIPPLPLPPLPLLLPPLP